MVTFHTVGTVPVFLGDSVQLKALLPHPKAAIFVSDFGGNVTALASYLHFLGANEEAYEAHRQWRHNFSYAANIRDKPILHETWPCKVCQWAVKMATQEHKRPRGCDKSGHSQDVRWIEDIEGKSVRGSGREIFLVRNKTLHSIPNMDTFYSLKLELDQILQLSQQELNRIPIGLPIAPIDG